MTELKIFKCDRNASHETLDLIVSENGDRASAMRILVSEVPNGSLHSV